MYDSGGVNVYYWPVTTTNGDFCAYNGSTVFAQPTNPPAPNTVITDGYTFTSPTNYISFATIAPYLITRKYHATACGVSMTNAVAAITGAMTTKGPDGAQSLNLEGLNTLRIQDFQAQTALLSRAASHPSWRCLRACSSCSRRSGRTLAVRERLWARVGIIRRWLRYRHPRRR
jgi:hypothetical protein